MAKLKQTLLLLICALSVGTISALELKDPKTEKENNVDLHVLQTELLMQILDSRNSVDDDAEDYYYVYEYVDDDENNSDFDYDVNSDFDYVDKSDLDVSESLPVPSALIAPSADNHFQQDRTTTILGLQDLEIGSYNGAPLLFLNSLAPKNVTFDNGQLPLVATLGNAAFILASAFGLGLLPGANSVFNRRYELQRRSNQMKEPMFPYFKSRMPKIKTRNKRKRLVKRRKKKKVPRNMFAPKGYRRSFRSFKKPKWRGMQRKNSKVKKIRPIPSFPKLKKPAFPFKKKPNQRPKLPPPPPPKIPPPSISRPPYVKPPVMKNVLTVPPMKVVHKPPPPPPRKKKMKKKKLPKRIPPRPPMKKERPSLTSTFVHLPKQPPPQVVHKTRPFRPGHSVPSAAVPTKRPPPLPFTTRRAITSLRTTTKTTTPKGPLENRHFPTLFRESFVAPKIPRNVASRIESSNEYIKGFFDRDVGGVSKSDDKKNIKVIKDLDDQDYDYDALGHVELYSIKAFDPRPVLDEEFGKLGTEHEFSREIADKFENVFGKTLTKGERGADRRISEDEYDELTDLEAMEDLIKRRGRGNVRNHRPDPMDGFNVMAAVPNIAYSGKKGPRLRDMFVIKDQVDQDDEVEEEYEDEEEGEEQMEVIEEISSLRDLLKRRDGKPLIEVKPMPVKFHSEAANNRRPRRQRHRYQNRRKQKQEQQQQNHQTFEEKQQRPRKTYRRNHQMINKGQPVNSDQKLKLETQLMKSVDDASQSKQENRQNHHEEDQEETEDVQKKSQNSDPVINELKSQFPLLVPNQYEISESHGETLRPRDRRRPYRRRRYKKYGSRRQQQEEQQQQQQQQQQREQQQEEDTPEPSLDHKHPQPTKSELGIDRQDVSRQIKEDISMTQFGFGEKIKVQ